MTLEFNDRVKDIREAIQPIAVERVEIEQLKADLGDLAQDESLGELASAARDVEIEVILREHLSDGSKVPEGIDKILHAFDIKAVPSSSCGPRIEVTVGVAEEPIQIRFLGGNTDQSYTVDQFVAAALKQMSSVKNGHPPTAKGLRKEIEKGIELLAEEVHSSAIDIGKAIE